MNIATVKDVYFLSWKDWTHLFISLLQDNIFEDFTQYHFHLLEKEESFLQKVLTSPPYGIAIVFNPSLPKIELIWNEFQNTDWYKKHRIVFFTNDHTLSACLEYGREGIDIFVDFLAVKLPDSFKLLQNYLENPVILPTI
jgi:hypothetical protein